MRTLTVKERIQLHLSDYTRFSEAYEAPPEVTGEAIARAVGIRVQHVNQYVQPLIAAGLVEGRVSHIQKAGRRRKAYFLTAKGHAQASDMRTHLMQEEVPFRDRAGQTHTVPFSRIALEDRRGSSILGLLGELQSLGHIVEARPSTEQAGFIDLTQEAPAVDRFYGREKELASILQALEEKPVVVATGITGIGKSTLGAKVCETLRGRRSLFWRTIRPWDTTTDLAGRLAGFLRSNGRLVLGGLLLGPGPKDRARIEDALAVDLRDLPALLLFDDAQNASLDAQHFFSILLRVIVRAKGPAVLLLSRAVPDFYSRRDVALDGSIVEIALDGLDRASSRRLLADAGLRNPIASGLADACGGVPLFLKLLASAGPEAAASTGWHTLETYIAEQVEPALGPAERMALEVASLYDVPVPAEGLVLFEEIRGSTVMGLRRKGLLCPARGELLSAHEAIRTFVRNGLSAPRQAALVTQIVPWLVQQSRVALKRGDAHAAISLMANAVAIELDPIRRRENLERLGDLRRRVGDVPGASVAYRTALKDTADPFERAILRRKIALCFEMMGQLSEAEAELNRGWQEIPPEPSVAGGWLAYQKADIDFTRGDYDGALREVSRVLDWMPSLPPSSELWGWLANLRGLVYLYDPRRTDLALARADFLAAADALEAADEPRGLCMVYNNLFLVAVELGEEDPLPHIDRSAALARETGDLPAVATALFSKAWYLAEQVGDYAAAEALYNETYRLAKETHQRDKLVWHYYHFAVLYARMGRYAEARDSMGYFLDTGGSLVNPERRIEDLAYMARLCLLASDPRATKYLQEAEAAAEKAPAGTAAYAVEWARAAVRAHEGKPLEAKGAFVRALSGCPSHVRGEVEWEFGRFLASIPETEEAKRVLREACQHVEPSQRGLLPRVREALSALEQ